jgi:hypothetical protein
MSVPHATALEKESLEAHVDLCALRYQNLESRLDAVEEKMDDMMTAINDGNKSMVKVLIGTAGTIIAGLLSTLIVIILQTS